jgi:tetratricopeptide (TPR) repeat protein
MKSVLTLTALICALMLGLSLPANAFVVVLGNDLAHDCYTMAKAGINNEESVATCDAALQNAPLNPHDRAGTFVNRGAIEIAMGRISAAMEDYNRGIAIKADLADAYIDRAGAFIYEKKFPEAMADVNHGIELGPTYPFVGYYNRAVAEQLTGDFKAAYLDYKKTLELEPKFKPAADRIKDFVITRAAPDAAPPG